MLGWEGLGMRLLYNCIHFSCCSPIAETSPAAAPRMCLLQLLLPDCIYLWSSTQSTKYIKYEGHMFATCTPPPPPTSIIHTLTYAHTGLETTLAVVVEMQKIATRIASPLHAQAIMVVTHFVRWVGETIVGHRRYFVGGVLEWLDSEVLSFYPTSSGISDSIVSCTSLSPFNGVFSWDHLISIVPMLVSVMIKASIYRGSTQEKLGTPGHTWVNLPSMHTYMWHLHSTATWYWSLLL